MKLSITKDELSKYVTTQLNYFYPDKNLVKGEIGKVIDRVIDRIDFCFKHVSLNRYFTENSTIFNHLYSDHYVMFLWYLSNTVFNDLQNYNLASKIYYLNKSLHGVDCMFDTKMPDIFLIFHGVGTMIGKANYDDYFVILQGCTVGSHKGFYPNFGKGVALAANSSIIGNCIIGNRSTISTRTSLFNQNLEDDSTIFFDYNSGKLEIMQSKICYAQNFFNINLNNI